MKKLLLVFCCLILSMTFAIARGTSCKVPGVNGQVVLDFGSMQSGSNGQVVPSIKYEGENNPTVSVLVYCYDAFTDQVVAVKSAYAKGYWTKVVFDVRPNASYYFRLDDAHCN